MEGVVAGAELSSAPHVPTSWSVPPETLYCEVAPRAQTTPGPVPPLMSLGPSPCQVGARAGIWRTRGATEHLGHSCQLLPLSLQALKTPEVTGHSRVQRATAWDSGSSLTLGSSPSPGLSVYPGSSPAARISPHCCLEPSSTVWIPPVTCATVHSLNCDPSPQLSPTRFPGCLSFDQGPPPRNPPTVLSLTCAH